MSDDIRVFSNEAIQRAIDAELAALPPDKHVAVVAYADLDHARLAVVTRLGDNWSLIGTLDKPYHGELVGAASIRWFK